MGKLRGGQKADLEKCLPTTPDVQQPTLDAIIIDGAVIVQMLPTGTACMFAEYSQTIFAVYLLKQLESARRVDLVWDVYIEDSLKKAEQEKRGSGQRRKVLPATRIPSDWKGFLRVDKNKNELFQFLAEQVMSLPIPEGKEVCTTYGKNVLSFHGRSQMSMFQPCSDEEADTRLMVHVLDAGICGHQRIMVRTNDTDVVVLTMSIAHTISANEMWLLYGCGKHIRYIHAHTIGMTLGPDKASVLPLFYALTDVTLFPFSVAVERKQPGMCGMCLQG